MADKWFFIINPVSGNGSGEKIWKNLFEQLTQSDISFEWAISDYHQHTIELVSEQLANGIRHFVGVGGDGTLNEMVQAIGRNALSENCTIGLIPIGSGNDWVRNFSKPCSASNIISKIKSAKRLAHDLGEISLRSNKKKYFFINVAGAGIDGAIVQELEHNTSGKTKGHWIYLKSLIRALFTYKPVLTRVHVDDKEVFHDTSLLTSSSLGQYFGSGMHISPKAKPDNGLLDFTCVRRDSNWVIFPQLYKLFNGQIESATFAEKFEGKKIEVHTIAPVPVEADGELLGTTTSLKMQVHKSVLRVLS